MSRNTSSAVTSASQLPTLRYHMLCEVDSLSGGTVYACTGNRFIYSSNTYTPVGHLGGYEAIQEDSDVFPRGVRIWFAAIESSSIADVLAETMYDKPVKLYRCFISDSYTVVGTPQLAFKGTVDQVNMQLGDSERGNFFELECESRLRQTGRGRYFNRETLQGAMGYSGDTFFDYVPQIPLVTANWGNLPANGTNGGGFAYPRARPIKS